MAVETVSDLEAPDEYTALSWWRGDSGPSPVELGYGFGLEELRLSGQPNGLFAW